MLLKNNYPSYIVLVSEPNMRYMLGHVPPHGGVLAAQHQPKKPNTYQPLIEVRIQRLRCLLERYKGENPSHFGGCVTESKKASQERGCYCERVREHTRTPQPSEKRGRRRRGESVQISEI
jgi:hypothetical protein